MHRRTIMEIPILDGNKFFADPHDTDDGFARWWRHIERRPGIMRFVSPDYFFHSWWMKGRGQWYSQESCILKVGIYLFVLDRSKVCLDFNVAILNDMSCIAPSTVHTEPLYTFWSVPILRIIASPSFCGTNITAPQYLPALWVENIFLSCSTRSIPHVFNGSISSAILSAKFYMMGLYAGHFSHHCDYYSWEELNRSIFDDGDYLFNRQDLQNHNRRWFKNKKAYKQHIVHPLPQTCNTTSKWSCGRALQHGMGLWRSLED